MDGSPLVLKGFKGAWCFLHIPTDGSNVLCRHSRELGTSEMLRQGELYIANMPQRLLTFDLIKQLGH